jgi:outer membrane protein TolC
MRSGISRIAAVGSRRLAQVSLVLLLGYAASPAVAGADQPLSLAAALRLAQDDAPSLRASAVAAESARQIGRSASQLPDPVLIAGVENLPIEGPDRFRLGSDSMTMRRVGVMQEYVSTDKRAVRGRRGEDEAGREAAAGELERVALRAEVAAVWTDRLYAARAERLLAELSSELSMQQRATQAQLSSGKAFPSDVLAIDAMLATAQDRALTAARQRQAATARLSRWLGAAATRPFADEPLLPGGAASAHTAALDLDANPQIRVAQAELAVAHSTLAVAQQDRRPNWTWGIVYAQRGSAYDNMVSVEVSVPLPIARAARQDREIAARAALVEQARQRLEDVRRRLRSDFESMRIEFHALRDRQRQLESMLLNAQRQRVDGMLAGYRSGQQSLADVLEARRAELDSRLQVLDIEREAAQTWARLTHLYLEAGGPAQADSSGAPQ